MVVLTVPTSTCRRNSYCLTAADDSSTQCSTSLTIQTNDAVDNVVALASDNVKLLGGTGLTSENTGDDVTFNLDDKR